MEEMLSSIVNLLQKEDNFLITAHIRPEGDSIGSQLAMAILLQKLGKQVTIINEDSPPELYRFLPQCEKILTYCPEYERSRFDVAIVLDCNQFERVGKVASIVKNTPVIINIDHHPDSPGIGKYNYMDTKASACAEQVYMVIKAMHFNLDYELALPVYVGIMTDTGNFKQVNTTPLSHQIVAELLGYGIAPNEIANQIYEVNTVSSVKLLGMILSSLKTRQGGRIAITTITQSMLKEIGFTTELEPERIIDQVRSIKGVEISLLFRDLGQNSDLGRNKVKVNLRSKTSFNVSEIAKIFDGGGHIRAAGCVIEGTLQEVERKVVDEIEKRLI
ncbi:MAG: bifunctional oligoribonuclease/PAP phosphatase NrnA [Nitrospirota bacterium]